MRSTLPRATLRARRRSLRTAVGEIFGVAEGVGVANGGGRAAARGVANARQGGLEEGRPVCFRFLAIPNNSNTLLFCLFESGGDESGRYRSGTSLSLHPCLALYGALRRGGLVHVVPLP